MKIIHSNSRFRVTQETPNGACHIVDILGDHHPSIALPTVTVEPKDADARSLPANNVARRAQRIADEMERDSKNDRHPGWADDPAGGKTWAGS